ncbi:MAG: hypothetical protein JO339_26410 [Alphaproteobacteria bacterium]|nr:hypothetical protein [Alphaproteobacteria bacterium]
MSVLQVTRTKSSSSEADLLTTTLNAHGGLECWNKYKKVEATIVSGGGFYPLKGVVADTIPRRATVWLHEQRSSVTHFGASDQRTMLTPERIAIEKLDGTLVADRKSPKDSFAGHQMHTPWDPLQLAYFNGEALWTYLTTPFVFAMNGVRAEEMEPWKEGAETWRVLRVYFPGSIDTHCQVQDFFFDEHLELRRHDYSVNIAGGFPAAQLILEYTEANGIRLPSKRRAYTRGPDRRPILDMQMVSIDISDVSFT